MASRALALPALPIAIRFPYSYPITITAAAVCLFAGSAGFTAADDVHYIEAADAWLSGAPFLGTNHWHLRHPHVLAIASSFSLFGRGEFALMLPSLLAYFGTLLLTLRFVRSASDDATAALAGVIVASVPVFALYAKIPYPDLVELFLCLLSFWFFWRGTREAKSYCFILAGVAIALAWLVRASCVPFILLYGALFLIGYKVPRRLYLWMIVGFMPLLMSEWLFYYWMAGDPLYRFAVDINSLEIPSAHMIGQVANGLRPPFNFELMAKWQPNSFVDVHWLINPYIDFFSHPSYGPIYTMGLVAGLTIWPRLPRETAARELAQLLCGVALIWIFMTIYVLNLRPQPRYFSPATWSCCILTAFWLRLFLWNRSVLLGLTAVTGITSANLLFIGLRADPMAAERALVEYARRSPEPLWSNLYNSRFLLEAAGSEEGVCLSEPDRVPPGGLFLTTDEQALASGAGQWPQAGSVAADKPLVIEAMDLAAPVLPMWLQAWLGERQQRIIALRKPAEVYDASPTRARASLASAARASCT